LFDGLELDLLASATSTTVIKAEVVATIVFTIYFFRPSHIVDNARFSSGPGSVPCADLADAAQVDQKS
jgi:hypothetical protein